MRLVFEKNKLLSDIAFLIWFFENAKYSIRLIFFQANPEVQFYYTAAFTLITFVVTLLVAFKAQSAQKMFSEGKLPIEVKLMAVFLVWSGLSLCWANSGLFTIGIWGDIAIGIITTYLLCRYGNVQDIARSALKGFISGLVCTAITLLLLHPLDTPSINRLGLDKVIEAVDMGRRLVYANLFLLYFMYTTSSQKERIRLTAVFVFFLYVLWMTFSKVSTVAFFVTILAMFSMMKLSIPKKALVIFASVLVAIAVVFISYDRIMGYTALQGGHSLETFSGRSILWMVSWLMIKENPLLGYGAGATLDVDRILLLEPSFTIIQTQSLNEWLNMWFQYGIFGLFLAILIYFTLFKRAWLAYRAGEKELSILAIGVLLFTLFRTPFESNLVGFIIPEPLIILLAFWVKDTRARHRQNLMQS